MVCLPTGGGKAVVLTQMAYNAVQKGHSVLVMAHRNELLEQLGDTATKLFKMKTSFVSPNFDYNHFCKYQIASVQTLINRLDEIRKPTLVIVDESHHYSKKNNYHKILTKLNALTVGFTATPTRLSGEPLNDYFDDLVLGPTTRWLIDNGFLCKYDLYEPKNDLDFSKFKTSMGDFNQQDIEGAMDKPTITGSAIKEYKKYSNNKRAVVFCVSVKHAYNVAQQFRDEGISAACIEGTMSTETRKKIISEFRSGVLKVVTNCNIVTEGFDLPAIESVIQLRPTASLSLYLQMIGRGLRTIEGKDKAIILDHVGNWRRHGPPCLEHNWTLDGKLKAQKKDISEDLQIKTCTGCFKTLPRHLKVCDECGHEFVGEPREINEVDGELEKVDLTKKYDFQAARAKAQSMEDLIAIGRARGMKQPAAWAKHVFMAREAKKRYGNNGH